MTETARLSCNLAPADMETLKDYAARKGVSVTDAVRRALLVLAYIDSAQARGAAICVSENGAVREVQFLV